MMRADLHGQFLYRTARVIGCLPLAWLRALGAALGRLAYALDSRETRVTRRNLALIGLAETPAARERRTRELMRSAGQTLLESVAVWTRPRRRVLALVREVHGEALYAEARARGKGVLLAVPHYGNWELVIECLAARGPFSLVYRVPESAGGDRFLHLARGGHNVRLVPAEATAMRPLLRALQNGETVGITPDHQPKEGGGEFAPFYGHPALTLSLIAKLAQRTGAPVLFAYAERCRGGFSLHFEAEEPALHDADLSVALAAMNRRVQAIADRDFRQYQWTYKRFSIRPDRTDKSTYR